MEEKYNKIFDVLVLYTNISEHFRENFVYHHTKNDCDEWRLLGGNLGFGGKYRRLTNTVDCYLEDENEQTSILIDKINKELKKL